MKRDKKAALLEGIISPAGKSPRNSSLVTPQEVPGRKGVRWRMTNLRQVSITNEAANCIELSHLSVDDEPLMSPVIGGSMTPEYVECRGWGDDRG